MSSMPRRGLLGDNPDISKAMRLLTASGKLAKTGRGGRVTPFFYNVRSSHMELGCDRGSVPAVICQLTAMTSRHA